MATGMREEQQSLASLMDMRIKGHHQMEEESEVEVLMVAEGEEGKVVANLAQLEEVRHLTLRIMIHCNNSATAGGGGYGSVGSSGEPNLYSGSHNPGASGGYTHGAPELATLDLGSGGTSAFLLFTSSHCSPLL